MTRGLANGRHEGLNNNVRLVIRRAYGFHTSENARAMVVLTCGSVTLGIFDATRVSIHIHDKRAETIDRVCGISQLACAPSPLSVCPAIQYDFGRSSQVRTAL